MKKGIKLKISDLRCDRYIKNTVLVLVLRDEESGEEILLPISDYEFRCIKNLVLKKDSFSYIDSLGKSFLFKKNELIIQDDEVKSKLTFITNDNFSQDIILPPIEAILYCADKNVEIFVKNDTFHKIKQLDTKARKIFDDDIYNESCKDCKEQAIVLQVPNEPNTQEVNEQKLQTTEIIQNPNIINLNGNIEIEEIKNLVITTENVKNISNENLIDIMKNCLSEYNYENVILIQNELKSRNIDFRHELCKEDFL